MLIDHRPDEPDLSFSELERHASQMHAEFNIDVLRTEAKLLIELSKNPGLTVKQAMLFTGRSYRGFYLMLERLIAREVVEMTSDANDKRIRRVMLKRRTVDGSTPLDS